MSFSQTFCAFSQTFCAFSQTFCAFLRGELKLFARFLKLFARPQTFCACKLIKKDENATFTNVIMLYHVLKLFIYNALHFLKLFARF